MSPTEDFGRIPEPVRAQAADWFARMRGPNADASRAAFETWYADPAHARAYDQLAARWEQSAFIGATGLGRERSLRRMSFIARHPAIAAAAAMVALVGGSMVVLTELSPPHAKTEFAPLASSARFESATANRDVTLSDGSHVTLDQSSIMLVEYSPARRKLRLEQGRARFDVAHDPARPFVVMAGASEVTAHGTLFDVALHGRTAMVTLLKGSISVRSSASAGAERLLHSGQQILVSENAPMPHPISAPADAAAWLPRMIAFDGTTLADAADQIQRGTTARVVIADDVRALRITGAFKAGDVEGLAHAAAAMFNLNVERSPTGTLLLSRRSQPAPK